MIIEEKLAADGGVSFMKMLLMPLFIAIVFISAMACNGSASDANKNGIVREDGALRVILNEFGQGASSSAIWVDVMVENIGSLQLTDFKTFLSTEPAYKSKSDRYYTNQFLFDAAESVCDGETILPGETYNDRVQVWNISASIRFDWENDAFVIVKASDAAGGMFWVDFTVPVKNYNDDWEPA